MPARYEVSFPARMSLRPRTTSPSDGVRFKVEMDLGDIDEAKLWIGDEDAQLDFAFSYLTIGRDRTPPGVELRRVDAFAPQIRADRAGRACIGRA